MVRRIVMWAAGVVLALSAAAWAVSLFNVYWIAPQGQLGIGLFCGTLIRAEVPIDGPAGWSADGWIGWHQFEWLPKTPSRDGLWLIPLWMPAAAAAIVFAPTWFLGHRRRRRQHRPGLCATCAYDLSGITSPCPECGREQECKA